MSKSSKRQMHPRNVFNTPPDYTALAVKYADFRKVCNLELTGKVSIDYKNESALRALTQMLLREYFALRVTFAPYSLVPTLPLRLNYILWMEDLVGMLPPAADKQVRGIDVGCGSSCVYSLLGAKKNGWHMSALETNAENLVYAQQNVNNNKLNTLIEIFPQDDTSVIFREFFATLPASGDVPSFHFSLCNPPFYDSSLSDPFNANTRNPQRRPPPRNCHTGRDEELACHGGEVLFVQRIVEESLLLSARICIFSSMLGHKSSLTKILAFLQSRRITNYCTTEFCQGNTTRWGVAWSFKCDVNLTKNAVST